MTKIAIVGSDGQLGYALVKTFNGAYEVAALTHKDLDITDEAAVAGKLQSLSPDIVFNAAALTKTELCEMEPEAALRVNALGAYFVAKACAALRAKIVYISTDYVFDGRKENFIESDIPKPLNVYGASKLAGELLTSIGNNNSCVVRTSWLFGPNQAGTEHNFVKIIIGLAGQQNEVRAVDDQIGSPTYAPDLAVALKKLVETGKADGIYHITNSGVCSWHDFAREILHLAKLPAKLVPVGTNESGSKIKRPKYSILKNTRAEIAPLRPWQEALSTYLTGSKLISE